MIHSPIEKGENMKKTAGIIGGMGPQATIDLFQKIVSNTVSNSDNEHIHILIDNNTDIPDRTKSILENSDLPLKYLSESAKRLELIGADFLAMPCNTAHFFYDNLKKEVNIPIINMIEETAITLKNNNETTLLLLATSGTIKTNIYQKIFDKYDLKIITPNIEFQNEIMSAIYDFVKKGIPYSKVNTFKEYLNTILIENKIDNIILGCTELPILFEDNKLEYKVIDPTLVLAKKIISEAGYKIKSL
ncbi:MAG: aspartate/glutamate racemase family protein [Spirochaetia bacterium]|nr:aspartate/glutamate racemase family protein [Spirochaetia bacterium]